MRARYLQQQKKKKTPVMNPDQTDINLSESGMSLFAKLVTTLGNTTKTNEKLQALVDYFSVADSRDKVWVIALFTGRKPKRAVNSTLLSTWAMEAAKALLKTSLAFPVITPALINSASRYNLSA